MLQDLRGCGGGGLFPRRDLDETCPSPTAGREQQLAGIPASYGGGV